VFTGSRCYLETRKRQSTPSGCEAKVTARAGELRYTLNFSAHLFSSLQHTLYVFGGLLAQFLCLRAAYRAINTSPRAIVLVYVNANFLIACDQTPALNRLLGA